MPVHQPRGGPNRGAAAGEGVNPEVARVRKEPDEELRQPPLGERCAMAAVVGDGRRMKDVRGIHRARGLPTH